MYFYTPSFYTDFVIYRLFIILLAAGVLAGCASRQRAGKPRVLVFSATQKYRHASIKPGKVALINLGRQNGFEVDTTESAAWFCEDTLKRYAAVVFLSTTGDVLNEAQQNAFTRYIQAGGGYCGIHAASDTEYEWPWYGKLVGGYFNGHPPGVHPATLHVVDGKTEATSHLPNPWVRPDEWYNFKSLNADNHILLTIDEATYQGGTNGANHPMAWQKEYDGGRAFYTALGHTEESYADPLFLKHVLGGIRYAIGKGAAPDYGKAKLGMMPDPSRFSKRQLVQGTFFEPTEMAILPTLDVVVLQRRGEVMFYDAESGQVSEAGKLDVYYKTDNPKVNAEEGMLGVAADPDFARNHYLYIYYSPADTSVNRLSRFTFANGRLDAASEKVVLQLYSQRQICCHTGGSLAFGADRLLYLSTGDNTTPFNEPGEWYPTNGYAPLDDRPGHLNFDGRRTSANSNDLRGKILRIKVNEDGSYAIPEGNLFAPGTPHTRPEIYAMGTRNPYRLSVDSRRGWVLWGDVGPDAQADDSARGPRGYDEINLAASAGNYGYPLFIADNQPYHLHDYATNANGAAFNPARPVNLSRNNGGVRALPPARPALIWYPYGTSDAFPQVGAGGRNAMAGPAYYPDLYPSATRLPDYYAGKVFIYDWIRGWMKAITLTDSGRLAGMEPFMDGTPLANPIDMELGPDGRLYVLEYGRGWFSKNPDAGLARLEYNPGNRPPLAHIQADRTSGALPFAVRLTADSSADPDGDALRYVWHLGNGAVRETATPALNYAYDAPGAYNVHIEVLDGKGGSANSRTIGLYAGNSMPHVRIRLAGNGSFYFPGTPIGYTVEVDDVEDGRLSGLALTGRLAVRQDFIEGEDQAAVGHQTVSGLLAGQRAMEASDCRSCHKIGEKSVGPSYQDVAMKYKGSNSAPDKLAAKIVSGGAGVWGEVSMPSHSALGLSTARLIAQWILSLKPEAAGGAVATLPPTGLLPAPVSPEGREDKPASLFISADYTDKGAGGAEALTANTTLRLRNPNLLIALALERHGLDAGDASKHWCAFPTGAHTWANLGEADYGHIAAIQLDYLTTGPITSGYHVTLRLDGPTGPLMSQTDITSALPPEAVGKIMLPFAAPVDGRRHSLWFFADKLSDGQADKAVAFHTLRLRSGHM